MSRLRPLLGVLLGCAVVVCAAGSCDDGGRPASRCPDPCPCTEDGCAAGWCGVQVTLEPSCADLAPAVELFVAGCLEPEDLALPGDGGAATAVACGAIAQETTAAVVARGAAYQWGPFDVDCPEGGGLLYPVPLSCP